MDSKKQIFVIYLLPGLLISMAFLIGHFLFVKQQPSREQLHELIATKIPNYGKEIVEERIDETSDEIMVDETTGAILFKSWKYYPFNAAFASNLTDNAGILTVEIAISLYDFEAATEVLITTYEKPAIMATLRSAILFALSSKTKSSVEGRSAQAALEEELLQVVNKTLENLKLAPDVRGLYITRFIIV